MVWIALVLVLFFTWLGLGMARLVFGLLFWVILITLGVVALVTISNYLKQHKKGL